MDTHTPEREKIFTLYAKLIAGKQWKEIEQEAQFSRQWFDKKRTEYGLPPPSVMRRQKKDKDNPKNLTRDKILEKRKEQGFLTMTEAAEYIGITPGVLAVQRRKGKIKGQKEGINIFFHTSEVDNYKHNHRRVQGNVGSHLTVKEAVELSGKSAATVYADIQKKKLNIVRSGSSVLISKIAFQLWLREKSQQKKKGLDQQEIIDAYRQMSEGKQWKELEISNKISLKGFDKRRSSLKLPPISETRKRKELALA